MTSTVAVILTSQNITIAADGKSFCIPHTNSSFNKLVNLYRHGRKDELVEEADIASRIIKYGEGHFDIRHGQVYIHDDVVPDVISNRILEFARQSLPTTPLVNFWVNLKQNPSVDSREQLYGFLEHNNIPLTDDGCFIAYKGVNRVNDNLVDSYTGQFDNNVGSVVEMDRDKVDDDPTQTCSRGLHVAAYEFASTWASVLVHVKVNPRDVVSVPKDYDGKKMRVCRYEVVAESEEAITTPRWTPDDYDWDEDDVEEVDNPWADENDLCPGERTIYDSTEDEELDEGTVVNVRKDGAVEIPSSIISTICNGEGIQHYERFVFNGKVKLVPIIHDGHRLSFGYRIPASKIREAGITHTLVKVELFEDGTIIVS